MKTPELKPCPFCGGEADFWNEGLQMVGINALSTVWKIRCKKCGAAIRGKSCSYVFDTDGNFTETNNEKIIIVEAWNRRVTDA